MNRAENNFEQIKKTYSEQFIKHGDSPSSLLTPKGRNALRFRSIDAFLARKELRILDYGCGLAYLYPYVFSLDRNVRYTGVDITPEFIIACREKYPLADFREIDALGKVDGHYDVVFASGVFNLCTHTDQERSISYVFERLSYLFSLCQDVLICDFLSSFVDFQQPGSQHFSIDEIANFCVRNLSRRFQIRHDLLPYEFTLIVWKDGSIKRPNNVYQADA
jgi:SAM-dependent methyltransferase